MTEANQRGAYLGWSNSPLCVPSDYLTAANTYDCHYSSDLERCRKTAARMFPDKKITLLKDWREMHFGTWEGKTYEELKNDRHYRNWIDDPLHYTPPGGESFGQFRTRVERGWKQIIQDLFSNHLRSCGVMTHGGVIRYLLSELAPEKKEFWSWQVSYAKGIELIFKRDMLRRGKRCILLREAPLTVKELG